ncbi:DUF2264 domain-containing protein [Promicromonospora sukumoe]|uniref:DUF2264 domain-containing protein n=1 Tax=Promicromonospora sukumoe TaxID=88382 RepID=UPI0003711DF2|nr:DUF2264 domain-containing protein [Promicromonospora sukumoe]
MTTAPTSPVPEPAPRWSRDRWLATADDLLRATEPYASPGRALLPLPGPVSASGAWSDGLEGFARTFLLAAFRVRGQDGADPDGLLERYAEGLRNGTDPASPERWPRIDERRQAVVEAASVAVGLAETRPWLWDRLDHDVRERVVAWLAGVVGTSGYRNNWVWFQNVIEAFLVSVGGPWDQADLDRNEELAEGLYVGDGWYSDGRGRDGRRQTFDWYAGWAWHLYPVLHARIEGRPLAERHAERLRAYLEQAQHLVGPNGAPLLQGRSVTYRFAVLAPFWAGALAGATPLSPGATGALTSAVAEHFFEHGAVDEHGLLPVGWHGRFDRLRQLYSGGASPYWASKGFAGLLLPPDHPVWTAPDDVPAPWRQEHVVPLREPGWLVVGTPSDGIVRVLNHGSDRLLEPQAQAHADDPFYRRVGYANVVSPQLAPADVAAPSDSHVALLDGAGRPSHRDGIERVHLGERVAVSRSRVHWLDVPGGGPDGDHAGWAAARRGPVVTTASVVRGPLEVRLAWWTPPAEAGAAAGGPVAPPPGSDLDADVAWPADPGPWTFRLGGWPLAAGSEQELAADAADAADSADSAGGAVRVTRADGTTSALRGLRGLPRAAVDRRTGADPLGAASVVPSLTGDVPAGPGDVVAALVVLTGDAAAADLDAVEAVVPAPGRGVVEVRWRDGVVDVVPTGPADHATDGGAA